VERALTDAELVDRYQAGEKEALLGCPARLSRVLDQAGLKRNRCPQRARRRPEWWAEVSAMRALGMGDASIGRCFGVTGEAVAYARKRIAGIST